MAVVLGLLAVVLLDTISRPLLLIVVLVLASAALAIIGKRHPHGLPVVATGLASIGLIALVMTLRPYAGKRGVAGCSIGCGYSNVAVPCPGLLGPTPNPPPRSQWTSNTPCEPERTIRHVLVIPEAASMALGAFLLVTVRRRRPAARGT